MIVDLTLSLPRPVPGQDPTVLKVSCDPDDVTDHYAALDAAVAPFGSLVLTIDIRATVTGSPTPGDLIGAVIASNACPKGINLAYKAPDDWLVQSNGSNPRGILQRRLSQATAHWVGSVAPGGLLPSAAWEDQGKALLALHAALRKAWRAALG